ncbi:MAG: molybdenum cofactor biosynthesis protein MoaE [Corynebacterium sp.]|nr:molybdenum cofactor biosynthesis protein MoaE [Corynebacterium sp.]
MSTDPEYVAAQTGIVVDALIADERLEHLIGPARRRTTTDAMGATVTFEGVVRDHDEGHPVAELIYSAHPTAHSVIRQVAENISQKHPEVRLWTAHRIGRLAVGDVAFVVIVAAAHRGPAFAAASELTDTIKATVPIWKNQKLTSGDTHWVGVDMP